MAKKEAHSTIKIPPMEYFKLDRAASILQCDTDDLLHYGVIGAIPLCIMMRGFSSTLAFIGGKDIKDPIEFYHEHKGNSSFLFVRATIYLILIPCSPSMTYTEQIVGLFYLTEWLMGYGV